MNRPQVASLQTVAGGMLDRSASPLSSNPVLALSGALCLLGTTGRPASRVCILACSLVPDMAGFEVAARLSRRVADAVSTELSADWQRRHPGAVSRSKL